MSAVKLNLPCQTFGAPMKAADGAVTEEKGILRAGHMSGCCNGKQKL